MTITIDDTLYITDLDGTLLGPDARLTPYTIETINRFIGRGGLFTIATGRTWPRTEEVVQELDLRLPMSFCNGAMLYDPEKQEYVRVHGLPGEALAPIAEAFAEADVAVFFYTLDGSTVRLFHTPVRHELDRVFRDERAKHYNGEIYEASDPAKKLSQAVTFTCSGYGDRSRLAALAARLSSIPGVHSDICGDVYRDGFCFLDICARQASKRSGMREIAAFAGASRTVAFGDNHNDLAMLEAADESYVTANGAEDVKQIAGGVIGSCTEDGVARFLSERFGL